MSVKRVMWRVLFLLALVLSLWPRPSSQAAEPIRVWTSDSLPLDLLLALQALFESGDYIWTNDLATADLALDFERQTGAITTQWLYVPVVPFASTAETLRMEDIRAYWRGDTAALAYLTPDDTPPTLVVSNETYRALLSLLGTPAEDLPLRFAETTAQISEILWQTRPYSWAVVGFNNLTPQLKVLSLDRAEVFSDDFDLSSYPLTAHIDLKGDPAKLALAVEDLLAAGTWQASNRDPAKLARVVLTGVTALARATAFKMEERGITYPAQGVMPFLADADILHTSNEVSFTENCGAPDPYGGVIFCSQEEYFELLTYIGLDVVELTGNHNNDYGPGASRNSLEMYEAAGIGTFGGGYTPEDARDAYVTEVKGASIAFIGCNVPGPNGAFASETREGAAPCDEAYLAEELPRLAAEHDLVIMGVQEFEYYRYTAGREQIERFQRYADWGADVVIGSQAHQPQGFTLHPRGGTEENLAFLHHGLGNFFFDQMQNIGTRQMFADKLIVYEGRLINVALFTGIIEDFCCPRPMTALERRDFLQVIFEASDW
jgi:poly-gamma-glutamate capsule biosynthesis protein CapA/YwtB (metallophosphatase superfamily)